MRHNLLLSIVIASSINNDSVLDIGKPGVPAVDSTDRRVIAKFVRRCPETVHYLRFAYAGVEGAPPAARHLVVYNGEGTPPSGMVSADVAAMFPVLNAKGCNAVYNPVTNAVIALPDCVKKWC